MQKNICRGGRHGTWRQRRKRGHRQCRCVINKTLNNDDVDDGDHDVGDNDGDDDDGKELIIICKILLEDIACGNTREPLERPSLHFLMLQSNRQMIMVQNFGCYQIPRNYKNNHNLIKPGSRAACCLVQKTVQVCWRNLLCDENSGNFCITLFLLINCKSLCLYF